MSALRAMTLMLLGLGCSTANDGGASQAAPRHIDPLCTDACTTIVASGCNGELARCEDICQADLDGHPLCPETFRTLYACCAESATNQCVPGGWAGIDYTCGGDCDSEEGAVIDCANSGTCTAVPTADAFCGQSSEYCGCDEFTMSCIFDLATGDYPVPSLATTCRELDTRGSLRDYCCPKQ